MDSAADRLAMIVSLGGQTVTHDDGEFLAIVESPFAMADGDVPVESMAPFLTARTIDVQALSKNTILNVGGTQYRLARHEPDGTGMTRVVLRVL